MISRRNSAALVLAALLGAASRPDAAEIIRPVAETPKLILPTNPPLVRPDGSDIRSTPQIVLPPGSVRLDPAEPILKPDHPAAAPLVDALAAKKPLSPALPPGQREVAAEAEKPRKSAAAIAVEAMKEAGAFDGARKLEQRLAADEPFPPAKDWSARAKGDIEDKLLAAAKAEPAANQAAIRALFLKYSDRLDWEGVHNLLRRLKPADDGSDVRLRDELLEAFLRERVGELSAVDAARVVGSISDPAKQKALRPLIATKR